MRRPWFRGVLSLLLCGSPSLIRAQDHGGHAEHRAHSHPPHAFYTHAAPAMRLIRPDVSVTGLGIRRQYTASLDLEWSLASRVSVMATAPMHHVRTELQQSDTGPGDVGAGAKLVLLRGPRVTVSAGSAIVFPSGSRNFDMGRGHTALAPFVLAAIGMGTRWSLQGMGHLHASVRKLEGHAHGGSTVPQRHIEEMASVALAWRATPGFSPLVELLVEHERGYPPVWYAAPGFRWTVGRSLEVGASARLPARYFQHEFRVAAGAVRRW